jgi:hypothetical protein
MAPTTPPIMAPGGPATISPVPAPKAAPTASARELVGANPVNATAVVATTKLLRRSAPVEKLSDPIVGDPCDMTILLVLWCLVPPQKASAHLRTQSYNVTKSRLFQHRHCFPSCCCRRVTIGLERETPPWGDTARFLVTIWWPGAGGRLEGRRQFSKCRCSDWVPASHKRDDRNLAPRRLCPFGRKTPRDAGGTFRQNRAVPGSRPSANRPATI